MCIFTLLKRNELVEFIQKIGHYQAARIIDEHKISGQELLHLNERDVSEWNLTEIEEELLWKCIYQLKLTNLTKQDFTRILSKKHIPTSEQKNLCRRPKCKYFKYLPHKVQKKKFKNFDEEGNDDCDYILPNNFSFKENKSRMKKLLTVPLKRNEKYELLTNSNDEYEYVMLPSENCNVNQANQAAEIYKIKSISSASEGAIQNGGNQQLPKSEIKSKGLKCYFNLLCCTCSINCGID